jgi:hypothetical protein
MNETPLAIIWLSFLFEQSGRTQIRVSGTGRGAEIDSGSKLSGIKHPSRREVISASTGFSAGTIDPTN